MSRDLYEEVAARHLQLVPGVFVRASHDPWGTGGHAEIDLLAIDLNRKVIIVVEVKSGGLGDFANRATQYRQEIVSRLKMQMADLGLEWPFEFRLYVKSDYQEKAEQLAGSDWDVHNLDDAFGELLGVR